VQIGGKVVALALQLAFLAVTARAFGPDLFGAFAAGWALVMVASAFADFAMPTQLILDLADRPRRDVERAVLSGLVATSTLAMVGLLVYAIFGLPPNSQITAVALMPWMVGGRLRTTGQSFLQADYRVVRIAVAEALARGAAVVGAAVALAAASSFGATVTVIGIGMLLGELAAATVVWGRQPEVGSPNEGLAMLQRSRDLGLTSVASTTHSRIDQVLFGSLRAEAAGGPYGVAYRVVDAALAVVVAAGGVVLPVLTTASGAVRTSVSRGLTAIAAVFGVAMGTSLFVAAPVLVDILGGDGFESAVPLVRVLAVVLVISVTNMPLSQLVIVEGRAGLLLRFSVAAIVLNVALNIALIPRYGAMGAAVTTLVTESLGFVAVAAVASRLRPGVIPIRDLAVLVAATASAFGLHELVAAELHAVVGVAVAFVVLFAGAAPLARHIGVLRRTPSELTTEPAVRSF
jgi:O-antigen/teichoic acid export membrane protein